MGKQEKRAKKTAVLYFFRKWLIFLSDIKESTEQKGAQKKEKLLFLFGARNRNALITPY